MIASITSLIGIRWNAYLVRRKEIDATKQRADGYLARSRELLHEGKYAGALAALDSLAGMLRSEESLKDVEPTSVELRGLIRDAESAKQRAQGDLARSRELLHEGDYDEALHKLDKLAAMVKNEERLKDIEAAAMELRDLARGEIAERKATEFKKKADRAWYQDFAERRENALLSYLMFRNENNLRWASDVAVKARSAMDAVGYREGDEKWSRLPDSLGQTFSAEQRRDINASALALLLILADVESQPLADRARHTSRAVPGCFLRAAGPLQQEFNTQAYDLIQAEVASRLGEGRGREEASQQVGERDRIPNEYDDFLVGQMHYIHGSLESAVNILKIGERNQR